MSVPFVVRCYFGVSALGMLFSLLFFVVVAPLRAQPRGWTRTLDKTAVNLVAEGNTVFAYSFDYDVSLSKLYRSLDGGTTWTPMPQSPQGYISSMFISGSSVYALEYSTQLWRSQDNGQTWSAINYTGSLNRAVARSGGARPIATYPIAGDASTLYIAAGNLYRSQDGGTTWHIKSTGIPSSSGYIVQPLDISVQGSTVFLATQNGIFYSINEGENWNLCTSNTHGGGTADSRFYSIVARPSCTLAYTENGKIWRTSTPMDSASWQSIYTVPSQGDVAEGRLVEGNGVMFLVTRWYGVYYSHDEGITWRFLDGSADKPTFAEIYALTTTDTDVLVGVPYNFCPILCNGVYKRSSSGLPPSNAVFTISGNAGFANASITLTGAASRTTTASATGNYSFGGLGNGTYTVTPSLAGAVFAPLSTTVTINNANATNINFMRLPPPVLKATYSGVRSPIDRTDAQTFTISFRNAANALVDYAGSVDYRGGTPIGSSTGTLALTRLSLGAYQASGVFTGLGSYTLSLNGVTTTTGTRTFTVQATVNNPVPVLSSIAPTTTTATTSTWTLTLNGSNFIPETQVVVNGGTLATQAVRLVSGAQMTAHVSLPQAGITNVWVYNPAPSGGTSATRTLTVNHPAPILGSIAPASIRAGEESVVTLTGAYFTTATVVRITRGSTTSTLSLLALISPNQATVRIPAELLTAAASYQVSVQTPVFGGGTSNATNLDVVGVAAVSSEFVSVPVSLAAGTTIASFSVRLRDRYGNFTDTGLPSALNFTENTGASSGTFSLTRTGVGVMSIVRKPLTESGVYALWIQGIASSTGTRTFTVTGAADNRVTISGVPASNQAGAVISAFTLRFEDAFGNLTDNGIGTLRFTKAGTPASTATLTMTRTSEGVYTAQAFACTLAGAYTLSVSSVNAANTFGTKNFVISSLAAVSTVFSGVTLNLDAGQQQAAFDVRFLDAYGNSTDLGRSATVSFSNATTANVGASTGTIRFLRRLGIGVYEVARATFTTSSNYELFANGFVNTGNRQFLVRPLAASTAEFAGVQASIGAGSALPAFTVTYRDLYRNLTNFGGTVMFKNVSNATVMGSFATTATSVGVVTAQALVFPNVGDFILSVNGIAAGNTFGRKTFTAYLLPKDCGSKFLTDSQLPTEVAERRQDFEDYISEFAMDMSNVEQDNSVYTIPVVVHIVQSPDMPPITNANVLRQIDILNQDFNRLNPNRVETPMRFLNDATSANIRFCLAQTDPFGFTTTGIVRYSSTVGSWRVVNVGDGEDADPNMKRIARGWEPSKYLNIWVVEFDGFLGYARFPWQNRRLSDNTIIDGVTMDYRSFGDQDPYLFPDYDSGRILTHEVGHWLGLYHIFTDLVYDALQRRLVRPLFCGTDLVNDTPIQRHDTRSTRSSPTACLPAGTPYFSDLGSSCELFGIGQDSRGNMFMNYMDYSNFDDCFNMFTRGQVLRMRRTLLATVDEREAWWRQGSRRDMVMSNTNCSAPSFQVFLTSNNDFATENTTISCEATARNGSGPYTFEWQYRELAVGDTQWPTAWNVVANNSTNMFSIVMQNVQSIQVRVTAIDANGQRITTSIIIRNLDNTRLPARQAAQARRRAVAPVTAATISLTSATLSLGLQISPNPASDRVSVSYSLPANSVVQVELLNVLNQVLATPVAMTQQEQGKHSVDINLSALQTGTYFIRCTATLREGRIISEVMPLQIVR